MGSIRPVCSAWLPCMDAMDVRTVRCGLCGNASDSGSSSGWRDWSGEAMSPGPNRDGGSGRLSDEWTAAWPGCVPDGGADSAWCRLVPVKWAPSDAHFLWPLASEAERRPRVFVSAVGRGRRSMALSERAEGAGKLGVEGPSE